MKNRVILMLKGMTSNKLINLYKSLNDEISLYSSTYLKRQ